MKKRLMLMLVAIMACICVNAQTKPSGAGTQASPFQIGTADELLYMSSGFSWSKVKGTTTYIDITRDIDMSSIQGWRPIYMIEGCSLVLNGNSHTIKGLKITSSSSEMGLFGYMYNATVTKLNVNATVSTTGIYTGIVAAVAYNSSFTGCFVSGSITATNECAGGFVGHARGECSFTSCSSKVDINSTDMFVGGFVGSASDHGSYSSNVTMTGCQMYKGVTIKGQSLVGGLLGYITAGSVSLCRNEASIVVNAASGVGGGLIGQECSDAVTVSDCANHGKVSNVYIFSTAETSTEMLGGIVGSLRGPISNCMVDADISTTGGNGRMAFIAVVQNGLDIPEVKNAYYNKYRSLTYGPDGTYTRTINLGIHEPNASTSLAAALEVANQWSTDSTELESGKIAYQLQDQRTDRLYWRQNIGTSKYPLVNYNNQTTLKVYASGGIIHCDGTVEGVSYTNDANAAATTIQTHSYTSSAICRNCKHGREPSVDGDGNYLIALPGNLLWLQEYVNSGHADVNARQTKDINMSVLCGISVGNWTPIGSQHSPFSGRYDGGNYSITNLYMNTTDENQGLFGYLGGAAELRNINLQGKVYGGSSTGMLVGYTFPSGAMIIENCHTSGTVYANGNATGGLIGVAYTPSNRTITISRCTNSATVKTLKTDIFQYAGGLVGRLVDNVTMSYCANYGPVYMSNTVIVGGLVGYCSGVIDHCGNNAKVEGRTQTGGVVGCLAESGVPAKFTLTNCYNYAAVSCSNSTTTVGMLIGDIKRSNYTPTLSNLYYTSGALAAMGSGASSFESSATAYDESAFHKGQIAVLMGSPWGQWIGEDDLPVLNGAKVYATTSNACSYYEGYSNSAAKGAHKYVDGFCVLCDEFTQSAVPSIDSQGYYLISNAGQLCWFRKMVSQARDSVKARQISHIDLSQVCYPKNTTTMEPSLSWKPIFNAGVTMNYDGQNHKVTGLYINATEPQQGLFGWMGYNGGGPEKMSYLRNLYIEGNVSVMLAISSSSSVAWSGIAVGRAARAIIENVHTKGSITSNGAYLGGVSAGGKFVTFIDCENEADVTSIYDYDSQAIVGGIVANASNGVLRCVNRGNIESKMSYAGGIAGHLGGTFDAYGDSLKYSMAYCSNTGRVHTTGGFLGSLMGRIGVATPVYSCWSSADCYAHVNGVEKTAGIHGGKSKTDLVPVFTKCYYNKDMKFAESSVAQGMTTAQFNNGEVAYQLGRPWGQTIDIPGETIQTLPVLDGHKVYLQLTGNYSNYSTFDVNRDGNVTITDAAQWVDDPYDINGDGSIDATDATDISDAILEEE